MVARKGGHTSPTQPLLCLQSLFEDQYTLFCSCCLCCSRKSSRRILIASLSTGKDGHQPGKISTLFAPLIKALGEKQIFFHIKCDKLLLSIRVLCKIVFFHQSESNDEVIIAQSLQCL